MFSERILIIPFSARFKKFHLIFWPEMCILKTVLRWLPLGVGGSGRRGAMMCPGKQSLNRGKFQSLEIRLKIANFPGSWANFPGSWGGICGKLDFSRRFPGPKVLWFVVRVNNASYELVSIQGLDRVPGEVL